MFENGDQGSTQKFDMNLLSIVVWPWEYFLEKLPNIQECTVFPNGRVKFLEVQVVFQKQKLLREFHNLEELWKTYLHELKYVFI